MPALFQATQGMHGAPYWPIQGYGATPGPLWSRPYGNPPPRLASASTRSS